MGLKERGTRGRNAAGARVRLLLCCLGAVIAGARPARADIQVMREVVIAPKSGPVAANIGAVNASPAVVMKNADVKVRVGAVPALENKPLAVSVRARFVMANDSDDSLALTVGFPLSASEFPPFDLEGFAVKSDGEPRSVFNRVTGYPRRLEHRYVSGPEREGFRALPDDAGEEGGGVARARSLFGDQQIGKGTFQNLMVWKETFAPRQTRTVDVAYDLAVPLQENRVVRKKVRGNYKGTWPQEANNVAADFLGILPHEKRFYFFDYVLVTGASWKGPIGKETVVLVLDETWRGRALQRSAGPPEGKWEGDKGGLVWTLTLRDAEPTANLLFALSPH